ncbi:MAG TPA: DUF2721 domain-containing protein [Cellvibrio sp.]|uniref:DUF2721 domain-containing protein n=1 Tax=Cellvibrio sp. TaxID=1965322 RepID=UPI000EBF9F16|nr:DUF2721 domain-containing protein [Cellvibrio sp.]HCS64144.1 DUF2721 domain-containing protein [Cellvibrio sp.]
MEMTITTPSLLFPAISLLMLAYTNRFVTLANVIRQLSNLENAPSRDIVIRQIENLRIRMTVIRLMQAFGVLSFVFCTLSMFSLLLAFQMAGMYLFAVSLILLVISLLCSFYEVNISTTAINIELEKFDEELKKRKH